MGRKNKSSENQEPEVNLDDVVLDSQEQEDTSVDELVDLKAELEESKEKYLRLLAEFENYKRRMAKQAVETTKRAAKDTMSAILPVLDDFDRARVNAEKDEARAQMFNEGVGLIVQKLLNNLKFKGLEVMDSENANFDAELHEAMAEFDAGPDSKGKIIDTVEKGYKLNGVIIRHAKVVVGK